MHINPVFDDHLFFLFYFIITCHSFYLHLFANMKISKTNSLIKINTRYKFFHFLICIFGVTFEYSYIVWSEAKLAYLFPMSLFSASLSLGLNRGNILSNSFPDAGEINAEPHMRIHNILEWRKIAFTKNKLIHCVNQLQINPLIRNI